MMKWQENARLTVYSWRKTIKMTELLDTYMGAILLLLLGIIIFTVNMKYGGYDKKSGYCLAAVFFILGFLWTVFVFLKKDNLLLLLFPLPIGSGMTLFGLWMILSGFLYSKKTEGTYIDCRYNGRALFTRRDYYKLTFRYHTGTRSVQYEADDTLMLGQIKARYEPHGVYPIWVNPRKPHKFRVRRFSGTPGGIMAAAFGFGLLSAVWQVLF